MTHLGHGALGKEEKKDNAGSRLFISRHAVTAPNDSSSSPFMQITFPFRIHGDTHRGKKYPAVRSRRWDTLRYENENLRASVSLHLSLSLVNEAGKLFLESLVQ